MIQHHSFYDQYLPPDKIKHELGHKEVINLTNLKQYQGL